MGHPWPVSAVRVDARRQRHRDLGRRQDLEGRRGLGPRAAGAVHGTGGADDQRGACASPRRRADEFPVRMLRDVRVSPDGKTVVYSALGRLYIEAAARWPAAPPHQRGSAGVLAVVLARRPVDCLRHVDGRASRAGSAWCGRTVQRGATSSRSPGTTPSRRSPRTDRGLCSGRSAAIRSRGPYFSERSGCLCRPDSRRRPTARPRRRQRPRIRSHRHADLRHRGAQREVHAPERRAADRRFAAAGPRRDRARAQRNATQYAVSPDGRWVAFEERFKTYIAPFPRTGRPVDIGPTTSPTRCSAISRDAGSYLHWSADSRRVHWALGPELFSRDVADTFAFAAAVPLKPALRRAPCEASRRRKEFRLGSPPGVTGRTGRWRWLAHASSRCPA